MAAVAEHRSNMAARDARECFGWWRAWRMAQSPFSPWPDPNAPAFVPLEASMEGPYTRTRATADRVDKGGLAVLQALAIGTSNSIAEGEAKNNPEELWHSWMDEYSRMEGSTNCEGCGKEARLWICDCGAKLCSSHCMGHCSNCGGEMSWGQTDCSHSGSEYSDTLSEDY